MSAGDRGFPRLSDRVAGAAILVGIAALWVGFSARDIGRAQHTREAVDAAEL
jgi:hypothetical protein